MAAAERVIDAVNGARDGGQQLLLRGHGSKRGWLAESGGEFLETLEYQGIVDYDPAELVVTARAGTPLRELAAELARAGQMLACDPPHFFDSGTVGGMVAAGLSGPARPWCGAVRDAVLGVEIVNGLGERLTFGGQVMKNVAGYDVSRLMAGSCGALGVILQASLRVQPVREHVLSRVLELDAQSAVKKCRDLAQTYLPLTGTWWQNGRLYLRLAGSEAGLLAAQALVGGEAVETGRMWAQVRDHTAEFFKFNTQTADAQGLRLWRVIVPPAAPVPDIPHGQLAVEWGGGQRWLWHEDAGMVADYAHRHGGWAWALGAPVEIPSAQRRLMQAIKRAFDPHDVFASPLAVQAADAH